MVLVERIAALIQARLHLSVFLPLLAFALGSTWYGLFFSVDEFAAMTSGLSFMDMQPTLTADILFDQIRSYDDSTVAYYVWWSIFDFAWPFITFTTMLFITGWLLTFVAEKWRQRFWLFVASAYATVLFDWAENVGFIGLVLGLPAEPAWLAQTTLALHAGKLVFNMVFNLCFWVLLVAVIVAAIRARLRS